MNDVEEGHFLSELLEGKDSIALGGHVRPDGDCIGSCLGLYLYLKDRGPHIRTDVFLEEIPDKYRIIQGAGEVKSKIDKGMCYDLFICLDCAEKSRLGFSEAVFDNARMTACIDHHIVNKTFGDKNYIFSWKSSTSELIFDLLDKDRITLPIAEALFMGIAHDTGIFQYSCTSPETMEAGAYLLRKGVDASTLIEKTYYEKTYKQNRLLGKMLYESRLLLDGKFVVSMLGKEDMDLFGATSADMDGIVNHLRQTKGVCAAMLICEDDEERHNKSRGKVYKLSLRSKKNVNVNAIAKALGGGGHLCAAGASVAGEADEIVNRVCAMIKEQLEAV